MITYATVKEISQTRRLLPTPNLHIQDAKYYLPHFHGKFVVNTPLAIDAHFHRELWVAGELDNGGAERLGGGITQKTRRAINDGFNGSA